MLIKKSAHCISICISIPISIGTHCICILICLVHMVENISLQYWD